MNTPRIAFLIISAVAVFQTGDALKCWTCSSNDDRAPCADYFNSTRFRPYASGVYGSYTAPNPNSVNLQDCDQQLSNFPMQGQRAVCMKKKQSMFGRTTFIRQCRFLHNDEKVGSCPPETTSSQTTVDFCEYCDYDGCNGAATMRTSFLLAGMLPLVVLLLLRK